MVVVEPSGTTDTTNVVCDYSIKVIRLLITVSNIMMVSLTLLFHVINHQLLVL